MYTTNNPINFADPWGLQLFGGNDDQKPWDCSNFLMRFLNPLCNPRPAPAGVFLAEPAPEFQPMPMLPGLVTADEPPDEGAAGQDRVPISQVPEAQALVGILSGFVGHFFKQMTVRGITWSEVIDAVLNPLETTALEIDELGQESFQFIGSRVTVAVNAQNWAVTVWRTPTALVRRLVNAE